MKMQLLIATNDNDYAEHLSNTLAEYHSAAIDVSVCSTTELLKEQLDSRRFDVALLEPSMTEAVDLQSINLPLLLWSEDIAHENAVDCMKIRKYQRISTMVSNILELYSGCVSNGRSVFTKKARVTVVWSPAGGVGKTTTALAFCAGKAAEDKQVLYLDMESFSSIRAYFEETGKSISSIFEMLETGEGNIGLLIKGICQKDSASAISYFCRPDNFDDMNVLAPENVVTLITACSEVADEIVIDMSCACDERTKNVFELADRILLVTDSTRTAQTKFSQFVSQNDVFQRIRGKSTLVANRGANVSGALVDSVVFLPFIQSADSTTVFKTLSNVNFEL